MIELEEGYMLIELRTLDALRTDDIKVATVTQVSKLSPLTAFGLECAPKFNVGDRIYLKASNILTVTIDGEMKRVCKESSVIGREIKEQTGIDLVKE